MTDYISLTLSNITVDEAEEIMRLVREIEERDPSRLIFGNIAGLESKSLEEAKKILEKIFPRIGMGG